MSTGIGAGTVSAYIQVQPPGAGMVTFPYNPEAYTIQKKAEWHATPQPASKEGGKPQYHGLRSATVSVKILLDAFATPPSPPEPAIAVLTAAMAPSDASVDAGDAQAPTVMFGWGTNIVMEKAYIRSLSVTYQRFLLGNPVRAEVTVGLEAVPTVIPGSNPTSGGLATRRSRTVVEGDTLASIAYQEYGDPTRWRALASVNDIDDPMRVVPGTALLVPDPREAELLS
jgi:nucleoid-associated protein YgaU